MLSLPHNYVDHPETWIIASIVIRRFITDVTHVSSRKGFAPFLCSIKTARLY